MQCQNGLTLEDGICHYNNCLRIVDNACVLCKSDYRLTSKGCLKEEDTFTCTQCAPGFHFYGGQCVGKVPGCVEYDDSGCKKCK